MMKLLRRRLSNVLSGVLGFFNRHEELKKDLKSLRRQLYEINITLCNGFKYAQEDPEILKDTVTYKYCSQIISLLSPMDIEGAKYKRIGRDHDGGYVMIFKMDIEGCEWDVLDETPSAILNKFSQIVLEFHKINLDKHDLIIKVLRKINETHQSIHVHANGTSSIILISDLILPSLLEVTYVRRCDYHDRFRQNTRKFPTKIDQTTYPGSPDIYLGNFGEKNLLTAGGLDDVSPSDSSFRKCGAKGK